VMGLSFAALSIKARALSLFLLGKAVSKPVRDILRFPHGCECGSRAIQIMSCLPSRELLSAVFLLPVPEMRRGLVLCGPS